MRVIGVVLSGMSSRRYYAAMVSRRVVGKEIAD